MVIKIATIVQNMFFNLNQVQKEVLDLVQIRNILNLYQTLFTNPMGPVQNCFEPIEGITF